MCRSRVEVEWEDVPTLVLAMLVGSRETFEGYVDHLGAWTSPLDAEVVEATPGSLVQILLQLLELWGS
jgi:hypothetical protein